MTGPRITHVRIGRDIAVVQADGIECVVARSGGVSTFSARGPGGNWWLLPAGSDYPDDLFVINDHGNHYNWEPNVDMTLAAFVALLGSVEVAFRKIS